MRRARLRRRPLHAAPLALMLALMLTARLAAAQQAPLPAGLVALDAPEGRRLLVSSDANVDFFRLANQWVSQQHGAFCGVASSVIVLNAMQLEAPRVAAWAPYNAFTQDNVFDGPASQVIQADTVSHRGMTLDQLGAFLVAHGVGARVVHAGDTSLDAFRREVEANLREPGSYVLANYDRAGVGQETMGHISPLGAFNAAADRFLIMDVARYKYPALWAPAADLFRAMGTQDPSTGRTRGYVLVTATAGAQPRVGPAPKSRLPSFVWATLAGTFAAGALLGALLSALVMRRRARAALARPAAG